MVLVVDGKKQSPDATLALGVAKALDLGIKKFTHKPKRQILIESSPKLVSPPSIRILNFFDASAMPRAVSFIDFTSYEDGTVTETSPKRGLTPFAAKSLTHAMTLFLAASYGFILFGTSEEAVIVSTATAIPFWPVCTYSISFLGSVIPMACLIIPVMRSSLTVSCL